MEYWRIDVVLPYRVQVAPEVKRELQRLPAPIAAAGVNFIRDDLARSLEARGVALRGTLAGYYGANRGDYWIIYSVNQNESLVSILQIRG